MHACRTACRYGGKNIAFHVNEGSTSFWLSLLVEFEDGDGDIGSMQLKQVNNTNTSMQSLPFFAVHTTSIIHTAPLDHGTMDACVREVYDHCGADVQCNKGIFLSDMWEGVGVSFHRDRHAGVCGAVLVLQHVSGRDPACFFTCGG